MNHNGNFDLCFELIKQAKLAGADIVNTPELGWLEFDTNYPANGDLLNGPYMFFRI